MEHRLLALVRRPEDPRPDAELLAGLAHDPVAFAELVARHGPMVWGVCRHVLGDADAEDAFQAAFLILARKAGTVRGGGVGGWLHRVAVRVALVARREARRRQARERAAAVCETVPPREPDDWADTMAAVHREVAALPEPDRSAFVLSVVEGLTQAQAAARLGRTPGAVAGQVARAKKRLAARLTERGLVPSLAALGTTSMADALPPGLGDRVLNLQDAVVPQAVLRLTRGIPGMTTSTKVFLAVAAAAVGVCVALSHVGSTAAAGPDNGAVAKEDRPAGPAKNAQPGRAWKGQVVERGTFKPIAGVEVVVTISADEDKAKNEPKLRRSVTCTTKDDGAYEFTVTPEEAARRQLYVEVSITSRDHPEYYAGYGYGLILKNEKLGVRPFYERIILWPGRTIEGVVKTPEGQPAVGVKVTAYTSPTPNQPNNWARFPDAKTDKEGRFRLIVHAKQRAVLWVLPQDYAPEVHNVANDQHDLGTFTLSRGERLTGTLRDSDGKPVGGAYVEARPVRPKPEGKNPLVPSHVANLIRRTTTTAADGSFEFRPLPARKYEVTPTDEGWDPSSADKNREPVKKPLPAVFLSQTVVLKKGGASVELDAVPHVVLEAQNLNNRGEKREGGTITLIGSRGDNSWMTSADPSPTGAYRILAPKGLAGASVSLVYDPDSAFQYRLKKDAPLQYGRHFRLGTLDADTSGVEIIHYAAPTLVLSVTTKDGKPIPDVLPSVDYTDPQYDGRGNKLTHTGKSGTSETDVPFETLAGGKIRTIQLVPDREVNVTARAEGYKPESRKITLAEGKTEEMKFVLEPE